MPAPLIPIIAGVAKVATGTIGRATVGQAAKTRARNLPSAVRRLPSLTGRTASGKSLQATKPRKQWDWSNMAGNFSEE
jgi:hypothetical protein